jgi:hypothetical protein
MLAGGGWDILFASRFAQARFEGRLRDGPLGAYHDASGLRAARGWRNDKRKAWPQGLCCIRCDRNRVATPCA